MQKLKLIFAVGLCVALLFLPLTGMADNPLPQDENADGHPWDDGENDEASEGGDPRDTMSEALLNAGTQPNPEVGGPRIDAIIFSVVTGNWKMFSGFMIWRLLLF